MASRTIKGILLEQSSIRFLDLQKALDAESDLMDEIHNLPLVTLYMISSDHSAVEPVQAMRNLYYHNDRYDYINNEGVYEYGWTYKYYQTLFHVPEECWSHYIEEAEFDLSNADPSRREHYTAKLNHLQKMGNRDSQALGI